MNHRALSTLSTMTVILALTAPRAMAHPGHGLDTTGVGLLHFLFQPSHGGVAFAIAIAVGAAAIALKRRRHG
jgi:hydrogenase/urease accessory protein HupE